MKPNDIVYYENLECNVVILRFIDEKRVEVRKHFTDDMSVDCNHVFVANIDDLSSIEASYTLPIELVLDIDATNFDMALEELDQIKDELITKCQLLINDVYKNASLKEVDKKLPSIIMDTYN